MFTPVRGWRRASGTVRPPPAPQTAGRHPPAHSHFAVNIGAFNLGNALSAWLGGLVIAAGHSYTAADWVGAALAGSALVLALISGALERATARRQGPGPEPAPAQPVAARP